MVRPGEVLLAIGNEWFPIESVVLFHKLLNEFKLAGQMAWPMSQSDVPLIEVKHKESEAKAALVTRLDKEKYGSD